MQNANKFPMNKIMLVKDMLSKMDESQLVYVYSMPFKEPSNVLILSVLVGALGVDRFVLGDVGLGILKLLTLGGLNIWWIIDMVNAQERAKEYNFKLLMQSVAFQGMYK